MGKKRAAEAAADDADYGEPLQFDPHFAGPLHKRSCTDVLCLLLFVAFVVAWAVVGYMAFSHGDPTRLIAPIDSVGKRCGVDEDVWDRPYLFYFDITKCISLDAVIHSCNTPQVCVKECPDHLFIGSPDITFDEIKKDIICKDSFNKDDLIKNMDDAVNAINNNDCVKWYLPSSNVAQRCVPLPKGKLNETILDAISDKLHIDINEIEEGSKVVKLISQAKKFGEMVVVDLTDSWPLIVGGLVLSMVLCLVYIVLMRWFAGVMVWVSLFGVIGLLSYCVYASYTKYASMEDTKSTYNYGNSIEGRVNAVLALRDTWLMFLIASAIMLVIVVILVFFLRNRIRVAVALIREASRAVGSVTSTLAFPLVPWVLQLAVVAWSVSVGLYLAASTVPTYQLKDFDNTTCVCKNDYQNGSSCTPRDFQSLCHDINDVNSTCKDSICQFLSHEAEPYTGYLHAFNIFGFFWGLFFMSAFGEMVLAATFATWYWTFKKSDVPFFTLTISTGRTLRYHLGTLAFGSLILAICRIIRVILEYINAKLKRYDNFFVKALMCCLRCFFWCLEKFIRFINRNAYIMCAIHGKNFCCSAKDAFNLLMRNIIRVFVLDKVTDFLLFLGKLMITAGMVALSFYFFSDQLEVEEIQDTVPQLNYYLVPVFVIGFGTYFIASVFFGVYSMAVDTLFLCFLEDCERNNGSLEKPYFMSKQLMKILGKKNKKLKEH